MRLVITLKKEVADQPQAQTLYDIVKARIADQPDVEIKGYVHADFDLEEE